MRKAAVVLLEEVRRRQDTEAGRKLQLSEPRKKEHYGLEKSFLDNTTREEGALLNHNGPYHTHCTMIGAMILKRSGRVEDRHLAPSWLNISRIPTCAVAGRRVDNIIEVLPRYCCTGCDSNSGRTKYAATHCNSIWWQAGLSSISRISRVARASKKSKCNNADCSTCKGYEFSFHDECPFVVRLTAFPDKEPKLSV